MFRRHLICPGFTVFQASVERSYLPGQWTPALISFEPFHCSDRHLFTDSQRWTEGTQWRVSNLACRAMFPNAAVCYVGFEK